MRERERKKPIYAHWQWNLSIAAIFPTLANIHSRPFIKSGASLAESACSLAYGGRVKFSRPLSRGVIPRVENLQYRTKAPKALREWRQQIFSKKQTSLIIARREVHPADDLASRLALSKAGREGVDKVRPYRGFQYDKHPSMKSLIAKGKTYIKRLVRTLYALT